MSIPFSRVHSDRPHTHLEGTSAARGEDHSQGFSIVLLARHSTSTRHSGALDGVQAKRVFFRALDPADLVFYRLLSFLREPDRFGPWNELNGADQQELLARTFYMWTRLADSGNQFSRVLSGLAGTNSRAGCRLARWWLLSERLPRLAGIGASVDTTVVKKVLGAAVLLRLSTGISRTLTLEPAPASTAECVEEITNRFFRSFYWLIVGNRVVRRNGVDGGPFEDVRSLLVKDAEESILEILRSPSHRQLRVALAAPVFLEVFDSLRPNDQHPERPPIEALERALRARERELRDAALETIQPSSQELAKQLCLWMIEATGCGGRAPRRAQLESKQAVDLLAKPLGLEPEDKHPVSRWESTSILVSPDETSSRNERSALNVFSANGKTISPVALHVLCSLQEAEVGMSAVDLRERLKLWAFDSAEIGNAFQDMVTIDRRLVYSGVKDFADGFGDWFDTYHKVHISSAGSSYLNFVVGTPAYLQWALQEPTKLREQLEFADGAGRGLATDSALGRLERVLSGLKLVREDEWGRARNLRRKGELDVQKSLSPVAWVYFLSLRRFIIDLSGQARHHHGQAMMLARDYLRFGEGMYRQHVELFRMAPREWERQLEDAQSEYHWRFEKQ